MVLGICGYGNSESGAVMGLINGYSNVRVAWNGQDLIYDYSITIKIGGFAGTNGDSSEGFYPQQFGLYKNEKI